MPCRQEDAYRFVMFAQRGVDHTTIEQYLGGVGYAIEGLQGFLKFVIVVMTECRYPRLYFLQQGN